MSMYPILDILRTAIIVRRDERLKRGEADLKELWLTPETFDRLAWEVSAMMIHGLMRHDISYVGKPMTIMGVELKRIGE